MTCVWPGVAAWTARAPEPHAPLKLAQLVVLLLLPCLPLSLLLFYISAQLAHFRQRKTKGDCTHPKKTPAKRKGTTVNAPVAEESPVATPGDGGLLGGLEVGKNPTCGDTPDGAGAAQVPLVSFVFPRVARLLVLASLCTQSAVASVFVYPKLGKESFILSYRWGVYFCSYTYS